MYFSIPWIFIYMLDLTNILPLFSLTYNHSPYFTSLYLSACCHAACFSVFLSLSSVICLSSSVVYAPIQLFICLLSICPSGYLLLFGGLSLCLFNCPAPSLFFNPLFFLSLLSLSLSLFFSLILFIFLSLSLILFVSLSLSHSLTL